MFPHGDGWYSPSFSFSSRLFSTRGGSRFSRFAYSVCWPFCYILRKQIQSSPLPKLVLWPDFVNDPLQSCDKCILWSCKLSNCFSLRWSDSLLKCASDSRDRKSVV